jgi:outer membrane receptor protein involved in Fe transport
MERPGWRWLVAILGTAWLPSFALAQAQAPQPLPPIIVESGPAPAQKRAPRVSQKQSSAPSAAQAPAAALAEPAAAVDSTSLPGLALPVSKLPGLVVVLSAQDVERDRSPAITNVLQQRVPGIVLNDVLGNGLANDLQLRGFTASPLNGTPQGVAVYQNGARINEVFGDTVNWDLIPTSAVDTITVVTNNPLFGLNALGGSVLIQMKNGFTFHGLETDARYGSFGRTLLSAQGGMQSGNLAGYAAAESLDEHGWRDFSPAHARRFYADIGAKDSGTEVHLSVATADTFLGVVGPTPVQLLAQRPEDVFTTPQSTSNQMTMLTLSGTAALSDTLKLNGLLYWRGFRQHRPDGNLSEIAGCDPGGPNAGLLCTERNGIEQLVQSASGITIPETLLNGGLAGTLDRTSVDAQAFGASVQATKKSKVLGLDNQLVVGASIDHGGAAVASSSELGILDPNSLVVSGLGITLGGPDFSPVALKVRTNYYGLYFSDTLDVTSRLALTAGGRFNVANIALDDQIGQDLDGDHAYIRFNPVAGATYKLLPGLWLYGGYSEANRAPTPAELACADPARPCLLENFLVADPALRQVVAHTVEAGIKGQAGLGYDQHTRAPIGKLEWSFGLFRTLTTDDILSVASEIQGRGYFRNAGDTLRQGVEASVSYRSPQLVVYGSYAFVDATFRNGLKLSSPNNPAADAQGDIQVEPGDRIPSIPQHRFKAGADYHLTPNWIIGADIVAVSSQFLRGDEANDNPQLPGYAVVNLHSSYDVTKNIQLYGIIDNLFDTRYATFGTFFDTGPLSEARGLTNPRMVTPAPPFGVYGGVRLRF